MKQIDPLPLRCRRFTPDPFDCAQGRLFGTEVPQDEAPLKGRCRIEPLPSGEIFRLPADIISAATRHT